MKKFSTLFQIFIAVLLVLLLITDSNAQMVSTFVTGSGLNGPDGFALDNSGNLFVANWGGGSGTTVLKITNSAVVTVFNSTLNAPDGLAFDSSGNLYVSNYSTGIIDRITPGGVKTVFAAGLNQPSALAFDEDWNLYVSNFGGTTVSKITPSGTVSTFASGFNAPLGLVFDTVGNLYVSNYNSGVVNKVTPGGVVSVFATVPNPSGSKIQYLVRGPSGNIYMPSYTHNKIYKISSSGIVSVFSGTGASGGNNGPIATATFSGPNSIALTNEGDLYVSDYNANRIRKITGVEPPRLPYIGQTPPDTNPTRFGPSYLITDGSWGWHGSPKFSPNGKEMFFVKYYFNLSSGNAKMYFMKDNNAVWTMPAQPGFASDSLDNSPVYSSDGNKLFFSSTRSGQMRYYYVNRAGDNWSQPQLLNMALQNLPGSLGWDFTMTQDTTIYFTLYTQTNASDIYLSRLVNGQYSTFERVPSPVNTTSDEWSPYISPDEKYLLFASNRTGGYGLNDIYVSFKNTNGSWTAPQNMGNKINGNHEDAFPSVTPDGKYMFFTSAKTGDLAYNAYWVDLKVIDKFKPVGIIKINENIPDTYRLFQNYPNPFNSTTKIKFEIHNSGEVKLNVFDLTGKKVKALVDEILQNGTYETSFNASELSSGIYFYTLESNNIRITKKCILLK